MPDNPDVYLLLGQVHLAAGRPKEALAEFQHGQRLRPDSVEIVNGLVTCYARLGDMAHAAQAAAVVQTLTTRRRQMQQTNPGSR